MLSSDCMDESYIKVRPLWFSFVPYVVNYKDNTHGVPFLWDLLRRNVMLLQSLKDRCISSYARLFATRVYLENIKPNDAIMATSPYTRYITVRSVIYPTSCLCSFAATFV